MAFNENWKREKARKKRWNLSLVYNPYTDVVDALNYYNKLSIKEGYSIFKTKGSKNEMFFVVNNQSDDWDIFYDKCILFFNK